MRQRTFVILGPHQIEHIDVAAAELTPLKSVGLVHRRTVYLPAHVFAARERFIRYRHLEKNQAPELLPRPDPHGAGYIRPHRHPRFISLEGWFDMPDLGAVLDHEEPLTHSVEDHVQ